MPMYTVAQGDCLATIAHTFGFADWRTIYNHASNAEFRRLRPNPNTLNPGDQIFIPETADKTEDAATDQWHDFKVEGQKTFFRVQIAKDGEEEQELWGKPYKVELGGFVFEGTVSGTGLIEFEIPANAMGGTLTIWSDERKTQIGFECPVESGHLNPVDTISGQRARLRNLGFDPGPDSDAMTEQMAAAIVAFQHHNGLPESGEADAATRAKLQSLHDGV
jgi:N-acetylmuramoyl-L-alanine amidase